jgi:carboxypeptidase Q
MKRFYAVVVVLVVSYGLVYTQGRQEKIDSIAIAQIKDEGLHHSQVMDILSYLSDVYGPRLTGSPGFSRAAGWVEKEFQTWGLTNVHRESWGPFGRGWSLKSYSANVLAAQNFPLISYPKAWSPAVHGTGEIVLLDAKSDSELNTFVGTLHGKYILFEDLREVKAHFDPEATREADSSLLKLANAPLPEPRRRRMFSGSEDKAKALLDFNKWMLCEKEGALAVLTVGRLGDGGNIFVQQAIVPQHPDSTRRRISVYQSDAPKILPQIAVGVEHYNRLVRMIKKGEHPKLDLEYDANFNKADSSFNIIAEIPGSDLKNEVVMIGGHFDSWHGGTGATDNGTGSAVCMEAMRLIKTLDLKPRRTIRIALWGGEEEGLLGSQAYVKQHFAEKEGTLFDTIGSIIQKPEAETFSVYFNNDNGSGKVRGVFMQGNEAVRSIFRSWLVPFKDMDASTLTLSNTGGTDHQSFDAAGLPGFQFIQDPLEYGTRTHHSTMDVYDRVQSEDVKQGAIIMAAFAYNAAMRDEKFPRKPLPQVRAPQSGK